MKVIKLTHAYTNLYKNKFFGIKTDWSFEDINLACAYIQKMRDYLPILPYGDDVVGEDDGIEILHSFYGFEKLYKNTEYDYILDFYDNWEEYCCGRIYPNNILNKFAVENASIKIFEVMKKIMLGLEGWYRDSDHFDEQCWNDVIQQLSAVIQGSPVLPEWQWKTIDGKFIPSGKIYSQPSELEFLPILN